MLASALRLGLQDMIARIDEDISNNIPQAWSQWVATYERRIHALRQKSFAPDVDAALRVLAAAEINDIIAFIASFTNNSAVPETIRLSLIVRPADAILFN